MSYMTKVYSKMAGSMEKNLVTVQNFVKHLQQNSNVNEVDAPEIQRLEAIILNLQSQLKNKLQETEEGLRDESKIRLKSNPTNFSNYHTD